LFSNGSEYFAFLGNECGDCPHFVPFEEATDERPVCPVEERIALASATGGDFPSEWLDENDHMQRYDCRKKAGLEPKEVSNE
jgi:hypothetical protein